MSSPDLFYTRLIEQLSRRSTRAVLGLRGFRTAALREHLRVCFRQGPGLGGAFLADPVFEATFGWLAAQPTLVELEGRLLHPDLVRALAKPAKGNLQEDYSFPHSRRRTVIS